MASLAMTGGIAVAGEPTQDAGTAERIVVTGERVSREVDQTATSVAVVLASELERRPDNDRLDQLLDAIPNLVLGSGGQGPTIRGQDTTGVLRDLPAFLGGNRPRATLVVDGRAISYSEFVFGTQPLWDVEQIEVFRSPQTTTQGRNSIAGAIFVDTRLPEWEWHAALRGIAGNYDTRQVSAMVTGPLLDNQLAFRIAGDIKGSQTSSELTSDAPGIDPNRDEFELVRVKMRVAPHELPGFTLDTIFQASRSQAPQIEGIRSPFLERNDPQAVYGIFRNSSEAITLRPQLELGAGAKLSTVLSIGSAKARRFAPAGFGEATNLIEDRSIEVVFTREAGALSILAGGSGSRSQLVQTIDLTRVGLGNGGFRDKQESLGVFGELRWSVLPSLNLIFGARYQLDQQERIGALRSQDVTLPLEFEKRYEAFSPKFSFVYKATEEISMGLLLQRAANPGGATLSIPSGRLDIFADESLWNYELFLRGRIPSARLNFTGNIFYYDIRNGQRSVLKTVETSGGTIFVQELGNVPQSWSRGAEFGLSWTPSAKLRLAIVGGFLETRVTEAPSDRDPLLGKEFQRSPHFTGAVSLSLIPVAGIALDLQYNRRSGYFSDDANTPSLRIDPADSLNARVEWRIGAVRVFGFVRNVFDRFDLTSLFANGNLATASDPREFGLGTEARF